MVIVAQTKKICNNYFFKKLTTFLLMLETRSKRLVCFKNVQKQKINRPFVCKGRLLCLVCLYHFLNLYFLKSVLTKSADGALEALRNLFPRRTGSDSRAGLSNFGVVFISTRANVFFHIGKFLSNFYLLVF